MQPSVSTLADELIARQSERYQRLIIGIAGIPGSGKSTLAADLVTELNQRHRDIARLLPMDGFHFTNAQLQQRGQQQKKGAPETFDVESYIALLRDVCSDGPATLCFPIYDRALHEPRTTGQLEHSITPATRIVITEGNYLLLSLPPWSLLADLFDECWLLDTPTEQARSWLIARHIRGSKTPAQALEHYERTDGPNTKLVLTQQRTPDRVLVQAVMKTI